jgi:hypothetical protein
MGNSAIAHFFTQNVTAIEKNLNPRKRKEYTGRNLKNYFIFILLCIDRVILKF